MYSRPSATHAAHLFALPAKHPSDIRRQEMRRHESQARSNGSTFISPAGKLILLHWKRTSLRAPRMCASNVCARNARGCVGRNARTYQFTVNCGLRASVFQSERAERRRMCISLRRLRHVHIASLGPASALLHGWTRPAGKYGTNDSAESPSFFLRSSSWSSPGTHPPTPRESDKRPMELQFRTDSLRALVAFLTSGKLGGDFGNQISSQLETRTNYLNISPLSLPLHGTPRWKPGFKFVRDMMEGRCEGVPKPS